MSGGRGPRDEVLLGVALADGADDNEYRSERLSWALRLVADDDGVEEDLYSRERSSLIWSTRVRSSLDRSSRESSP